MIENVSQFIGTMAETPFGKAARRSVKTIWNAQLAALETTRHEAGKILVAAIDESQKLDAKGRKKVDRVLGSLAGNAGERLSTLEHAFQRRVTRAIRVIGLPTAGEFEALSRRVDALSSRTKPRGQKKSARRSTRRAA